MDARESFWRELHAIRTDPIIYVARWKPEEDDVEMNSFAVSTYVYIDQ